MMDSFFGFGRTSVFESYDSVDAEVELSGVSECAGDPFEYATAIMYENEAGMQRIETAIMVSEYTYLKENGVEMVNETGVVGNFFKSLGEHIAKVWAAIQKFFKKIFNWIAEKLDTDKPFVKKYEDDCKKAGNVDISKYKNTVKAVNYDLKVPFDMIESVKAGITKDPDIMNMAKTMDEFRGDVVGAGPMDHKKFVEAIDKAITGEGKKNDITKVNCVDAITEVKVAKLTKDALNRLYNEARKTIKTAQDEAKKAEKKAKSDKAESAGKQAHAKGQLLKVGLTCATLICNKGCKAITMNNRQNKKLIGIALKVFKDDNGKGDTKVGESTLFDDIFSAIC